MKKLLLLILLPLLLLTGCGIQENEDFTYMPAVVIDKSFGQDEYYGFGFKLTLDFNGETFDRVVSLSEYIATPIGTTTFLKVIKEKK